MAKTMNPEPTELSPSTPSSPSASSSAPPSHVPTRGLYGHITHTDLASSDPTATRNFCAKVFGWTFKPPFPTPAGEYHLFAYSDQGGGGVRRNTSPEVPGSVPFVHVEDAQAAFDAAVREGAEVMQPPERVMPGVTIAIVRAPGGVTIGLSGP
jgi:predicted enzyme related to lactoylglutathione lyase